jgi:MoxR-like ATPase
MTDTVEAKVEQFRRHFTRLGEEVSRVIVGHHEIIEGVLTCILSGGHALLEGVPGLGKTMLVRSLADALKLAFSRIQFTPDLMPADVIGTNMIVEDEHGHKRFEFQRGPVFANILLADEINRATPKTQSALLEAMQEQRVTVARSTYELHKPFFVLATQNPLEMEGTYPLPEAQLDRFLFKLQVRFPSRDELHAIVERTTQKESPSVSPVFGREEILWMSQLLREVPVARHVQDYAVRLIEATHPGSPGAAAITNKYIRYGASPRGAQAVLLGAKARALVHGRFAVSYDDLRATAKAALRHRIILNFEGEAEGIATDGLIDDILKTLPEVAP